MTITLQALLLVENAEPVQVRFTYPLGTDGVCECKMDVKSTWIPNTTTNGSCFISLGPVLEGRPNTKPRHFERSQPLTSSLLSWCEDPREKKFIEIAFG